MPLDRAERMLRQAHSNPFLVVIFFYPEDNFFRRHIITSIKCVIKWIYWYIIRNRIQSVFYIPIHPYRNIFCSWPQAYCFVFHFCISLNRCICWGIACRHHCFYTRCHCLWVVFVWAKFIPYSTDFHPSIFLFYIRALYKTEVALIFAAGKYFI